MKTGREPNLQVLLSYGSLLKTQSQFYEFQKIRRYKKMPLRVEH